MNCPPDFDPTNVSSEGAPKLEDVRIERLIGEAAVLDLDRGGEDHGYSAPSSRRSAPACAPGTSC